MSLRVATYNIRKGGLRRRALIAAVLDALDADITVLQEATDPRVVDWLARELGSSVAACSPGRSVAVLSRSATGPVTWHRLPTGRMVVEIALPDHEIRIIAVHLSAGLSARGERRRAWEIERVLEIAAGPPGPARTAIVGDLNAISPGDAPRVSDLPAWIRLLLRADGGISTSVVARVLADGFVDAYRLLNPGDPGSTLPAAAPTVRLDYLMLGPCLVPEARACAIGQADRALLMAASDHLPLLLELDDRVRPAGPCDDAAAAPRASSG